MDTIKAYLKRILVTDWKTSLFGVLAILPQISTPLMTYLGTLNVQQKYLNAISFVFAILFALETKQGEG